MRLWRIEITALRFPGQLKRKGDPAYGRWYLADEDRFGGGFWLSLGLRYGRRTIVSDLLLGSIHVYLLNSQQLRILRKQKRGWL